MYTASLFLFYYINKTVTFLKMFLLGSRRVTTQFSLLSKIYKSRLENESISSSEHSFFILIFFKNVQSFIAWIWIWHFNSISYSFFRDYSSVKEKSHSTRSSNKTSFYIMLRPSIFFCQFSSIYYSCIMASFHEFSVFSSAIIRALLKTVLLYKFTRLFSSHFFTFFHWLFLFYFSRFLSTLNCSFSSTVLPSANHLQILEFIAEEYWNLMNYSIFVGWRL